MLSVREGCQLAGPVIEDRCMRAVDWVAESSCCSSHGAANRSGMAVAILVLPAQAFKAYRNYDGKGSRFLDYTAPLILVGTV